MTSAEPRPTGRWRQEVLALLLLFVALFVLLSLCSYLLPLVQAEPGLQRPEANWCGSLGYYTAHYLLSFLGLMAFLPVGILLYAMVSALVRRPEDHRLPFLVAGLSGVPAGTWGCSSTAC
jgi:S-DNA-T family DNA segregation ATPase FtsK/SpoIIIE